MDSGVAEQLGDRQCSFLFLGNLVLRSIKFLNINETVSLLQV